jgi:hypothetical protein
VMVVPAGRVGSGARLSRLLGCSSGLVTPLWLVACGSAAVEELAVGGGVDDAVHADQAVLLAG